MIEYEYAPPRAPVTEQIKINGEVVGEVWTTVHGYQCQLKFGPLKEDYRGLTLNGIGDSKTAAIRNAMRSGREDAERLQRAVQILDAEMGVE